MVGGPDGDCGLTGRKIIVDTYGGYAPHGGGAFSGKDPTKVDRSAAYAARYLAKNVVAAGLAERCTIQVAYAIGVADPMSLLVDTHGTGKVDERKLEKILPQIFRLTPTNIRRTLKLNRPIYRRTAAYGHFGRAPGEGRRLLLGEDRPRRRSSSARCADGSRRMLTSLTRSNASRRRHRHLRMSAFAAHVTLTRTGTQPRAFFGRRKGHPLRPQQAALFDTLLPRLALDLDAPPPGDLAQLVSASSR